MKRNLTLLAPALVALTALTGCSYLGLSDSGDKAAMTPPPAAVAPPPAPVAPQPTLAVAEGWAAVTPKGAKVAAGYFTAANGGTADDKLLSASSPRATRVELHEMSMSGKTMKMRPLKDGVAVPAGGSVAFKEGGMHLMFMGITAPFVDGEAVPVKLTFEKAGDVEVTLTVKPAGNSAQR